MNSGGLISAESIAHRQWNNILTHNAILDLNFVPDTEGVVVDSGDMMDIVKGINGEGKCVQLTGATGHIKSAEITDVVFPILTKSKTSYAYATCDTTLTLTDTKDTILSLAVLLKTGFKVDFATDSDNDPTFGGYLITSAGSHATLVFENNLWRVS